MSSEPPAKRSTGPLIVTAAVTAVAGLIAGVLIGRMTADTASSTTPDTTPMNTGIVPSGFPEDAAANLPTALASTAYNCRDASVVYSQDGDATGGTVCYVTINGLHGDLAYADDPAWVSAAHDYQGSQPGFREITVPGFDAYEFTWNIGNRPVTSTALIDSDQEFYIDLIPQSAESPDGVPTDTEIREFTNAVREAIN